MIKYFFLISIFSIIQSNQFKPENNSGLNYRQIEFSWPQIPSTDSYIITINDINSDFSRTINTVNNIAIYTGYDLNWDTEYNWQVCGLYNNDISECYNELFFSIRHLPGNPLPTPNILINDDLNDNKKIIYNGNNPGRGSVMIDNNGFLLWFLTGETVHHMLKNGNFTWANSGIGQEINRKGDTIFETPMYDLNGNLLEVHHSFKKTKNNTYITHIKEFQINSCPPSSCPDIVYSLYPDGNIIWRGDVIIEFDSNGNIIWEWNLFDEIGAHNYNPFYIENLGPGNNFTVDWTHSNEVFFSEDMTSLYTSIRNLNTINKIDYQTKEIIWSLGDLDSNYYFNESPTFNHQHTPTILDNNNLLLFNNGTYNEPQLSSCQEYLIDNENNTFDLIWEFILPDSMYTKARGECHRLNNGNTLIATGQSAYFLELDNNNEIIFLANSGLNNVNRIMKVEHLYPTSFNVKFDNFIGTINNPLINISNTEELSFNIINNGWIEDSYNVNIYNDNIDYHTTINNIAQNTTENYSIHLHNLNNESNLDLVFPIELNFSISSLNDPNNELIYNFMLISDGSQIYDINQDSVVNILDINQLIYCILNECENNFDTNNDGLLNIVDIIGIINYIFENL